MRWNGDIRPGPAIVIEDLVASVGAVLNVRLADITGDLLLRLSSEIEHLAGDDRLVQLMSASIEGNVETFVHLLRHGIDVERTEAPPAAVEYARRLAQRGVPVNALIRCYRLGQDSFLRWSLEELSRQSDDAEAVSSAALRIVAVASAYIDRVSQTVVAVYEHERDLWLLSRGASRSARIRDLIDGRAVDVASAEDTLGYRLSQHHLGLVVWAERDHPAEDRLAGMEHSVLALAEALDCAGRPLFAPCDELSAWAWLPMGPRRTVDSAVISTLVDGWERPVRVAVGEPHSGVAGFRRTHRQAVQAQAVALAGRAPAPSCTAFGEVGPVALMCSDMDATREWVAEALGALAIDDDAHARLRETLRAFLASEGSYVAAAERLGVHRNTVVYRLRRAAEERGRPLRDDRLGLETALAVCHWLGAAVLVPPRR